jgi:Asp-tRNA(Asn)/Glu-tRNA(Gln) amidotransferase A subunit family amidase
MKLTVGASSTKGVISISRTFDTLGGMGKTVKDVALLSDLLLNPEVREALPGAGLISFLTDTWKGISVGFVDAALWQLPPRLLVSDDEYKQQMVSRQFRCLYSAVSTNLPKKSALEDAAVKVKEHGARVIGPVELPPASSLKVGDEAAMTIVLRAY